MARVNRCRSEVSRGEIAKEPRFRDPAESTLDEIGNLGDDKLGHEQRPRMGFKKLQACVMVAVVFVHVRVERPGIDDQRDWRASRLLISSMCLQAS